MISSRKRSLSTEPSRISPAFVEPTVALLNEVTRLEPENYEAWLDLGICYAQKGFYQEAERCYAEAIRPG